MSGADPNAARVARALRTAVRLLAGGAGSGAVLGLGLAVWLGAAAAGGRWPWSALLVLLALALAGVQAAVLFRLRRLTGASADVDALAAELGAAVDAGDLPGPALAAAADAVDRDLGPRARLGALHRLGEEREPPAVYPRLRWFLPPERGTTAALVKLGAGCATVALVAAPAASVLRAAGIL